VVLPSERGDVDVTICNERNMTSLAARFRKLLRSRPAADTVQGLDTPPLIIRHAALEISSGARKTREYLGQLERLGCRFVRPDADALAELEAVRGLMSDARSGDLSCRGETIDPVQVERFLLGLRSEAAKLRPLLIELAGSPAPSHTTLDSAADHVS
jgi:hypothetical protein